MSAERATVAFRERDLLLAPHGEFALALSAAVQRADVSLVLDIYDLSDPVHPRGHFGWWKFALEDSGPRLRFSIALSASAPRIAIDGTAAVDAWVNEAPPASDRLLINAVLRANTTNAIVDLDRLPAFGNAAALAAFRSTLDRDWRRPRFATPHFVPREGETTHIVARDIYPRDAVGNLCLDLYRLLRQSKIEAALYADNFDISLNDIVVRKTHLAGAVRPHDQLIYFYATHEPQLAEICAIPCRRKTLYFHGLTDPRRLQVFEPEQSHLLLRALADLPKLGGFDRLAANSAYNADRLHAGLGPAPIPLADIKVIPPKILSRAPPSARAAKERVLLAVGQLRPHKKIEDFLRLIAAVRAQDASVRAAIVGTGPDAAYRDYLRFVETEELELPRDCVEWRGSIAQEELDALYARAGLFVSMSEDEGFCLPVFEAMRSGLPVLAYGLPAVIDLLGGTGRYFTAKNFPQLARLTLDILGDQPLWEEQSARQRERAAALANEMDGRAFLELIAPRPGEPAVHFPG